MKSSKKTLALMISTSLLAGTAVAELKSNPFELEKLSQGYTTLAMSKSPKEGKCGEGKCGTKKKKEAKCGEGKCGAAKKKEGKCGEGKCGSKK